VSDIHEYLALHGEERKTEEQRHEAYLALLHHEKYHGRVPEESGTLRQIPSLR
jgi:hypothetical protein